MIMVGGRGATTGRLCTGDFVQGEFVDKGSERRKPAVVSRVSVECKLRLVEGYEVRLGRRRLG